jgi:hypothetical protein
VSDLSNVKAGKYRLTALKWRKVTSKPGEPYDYVQYRRGDVVDLNVEDARRLVKAGAVEPIEAKEPPSPTPGSVKSILEGIGDDAEKAKAALEQETGEGGENRASLVKKLEAIVAKAAGGTPGDGQGGTS